MITGDGSNQSNPMISHMAGDGQQPMSQLEHKGDPSNALGLGQSAGSQNQQEVKKPDLMPVDNDPLGARLLQPKPPDFLVSLFGIISAVSKILSIRLLLKQVVPLPSYMLE